MTTLKAGFGRADITPHKGGRLVGYGGRDEGNTGANDPLLARALVIEAGRDRYALLSLELCYVNDETVQSIRQALGQRFDLAAEHVHMATTHTHGGPDDRMSDNWDRPLAEIVGDAVGAALASLQPCRLGSGSGFLHGHSINRRWLDRPVDPAVAVVRIDDAQGRPLGVIANYACHAVVMGYDNLRVTGDWPGYAARYIEEDLGPGTTCLFFQGGAGDINPLVEGVRQQLRGERTVRAIGEVSAYYGPADDTDAYNVGDRGGGTFQECEELGRAFRDEVLRVSRRIATTGSPGPIWAESLRVDALKGSDEPAPVKAYTPHQQLLAERPMAGERFGSVEIALLGIGDTVLITEPGEVFSETAVRFRAGAQLMGYRTVMLVSYANDWLLYLPEFDAFDEGGYEPGWAVALQISRRFQERVWNLIEPRLRSRAP